MWQSDPLWVALAAMRVGPDGAASRFTGRLASENGWSHAHARAVEREYRRFLYLVAKTGEMLTPSDQVDQAWHLHLLHSRHYWETLCACILRRPLHHDPAGIGEAARHQRQYEATLARYRGIFGEAPPPAIWPAHSADGPLRPLRIDAAKHWLVPRLRGGRAAALAGATALIAACSALVANKGGQGDGATLVSVLIVVGSVAGLALLCRLLMRGGGKGGGGGCSAFGGCGGGGDSHGGGHGGGGHGCGGHGGGGHGCGGHGCGGGCGGGH